MSKRTKTEEEVWKDIESGKYADCYLVYIRKSTDDTKNQKNSISYQKAEIERFAQKEGLLIAPVTLSGLSANGVITEKHSGFKEDDFLVFGEDNSVEYRMERPKLFEVLRYAHKGYFKGVIALSWDRVSRNKSDTTLVRKLMNKGVEVRFAMAQYEKSSAGEMHLDMDGIFAEHHSRTTREKVTLTIRNARSKGLCTHRAPVGYLNEGNMYWKPKDPEKAPVVKRLFELAATGEWSLADLARWANEQGFTMSPQRRRRTQEEHWAEAENDSQTEIEAISRPATYTSIHKILTNPFYTGRVPGNDGEWIQSASHEYIIDESTFRAVQAQLQKKNKSVHYKEVVTQPLRGLVRCGDCERVYTPYTQKGIVYYGSRCKAGCTNTLKNVNFNYLGDKAGELISQLSFTEEELAEIDARTTTEVALLDVRRINQIEAGERKKKRIREDLAYLAANRLDLLKSGAYTPASLVAEENKLNTELNALNDAEAISDISMAETVKDSQKLSELLKNIGPIYELASPEEKNKIVRTIFSELSLTQNTFEYKAKKGFEALSSRFAPNCDPTGNRTPISCVKGGRPNR